MKYLKLSGKLCMLLCGSLLAGLLLLWCAFLLPEGSIMNHAVSSAETFSYEGIDAAVGYAYSERLDNWTDALMIGNACYQKEGAGALERAAAAYRPGLSGGESHRIPGGIYEVSGRSRGDSLSAVLAWVSGGAQTSFDGDRLHGYKDDKYHRLCCGSAGFDWGDTEKEAVGASIAPWSDNSFLASSGDCSFTAVFNGVLSDDAVSDCLHSISKVGS